MSKIEWTDETWNPIVGCEMVSPACMNCYAMAMAARIERMSAGSGRQSHYEGTTRIAANGKDVWTGAIKRAPDDTWTKPLRWKKPRRIFVNSMSDLFHESIPDEWIDRAFAVMALAPQHTFQVLTKRPARMREYFNGPYPDGNGVAARIAEQTRIFAPERKQLPKPPVLIELPIGPRLADGEPEFGYRRMFAAKAWPLPNVWLGVTAEDQPRANERIPDLLATPASIRFVSCEPLLGPLALHNLPLGRSAHINALTGETLSFDGDYDADGPHLDQVITGGESGPGARPSHPDWFRGLRDQCAQAGVPFFFKQHGEWIGVPDLRNLPGGSGPGFGAYDHCQHDMQAESVRVGKSRAGHLLDGREHREFPEARR